MALRYVGVSAAGAVAESLNNTATLVTTAGTANAAAGAKADVTAELAAVTASIPTQPVFVAVDTSTITSLNTLRQLLDAAFNHIKSTNLLT